jgi:hypothetical protein
MSQSSNNRALRNLSDSTLEHAVEAERLSQRVMGISSVIVDLGMLPI